MSEGVLRPPISSLIRQSCKRFDSTRLSSQASRTLKYRTASAVQTRKHHTADVTPRAPHHDRSFDSSRIPTARTQSADPDAGAGAVTSHLTDTFGRNHNYLRISLTERCNLRCVYCMPEDGITLSPPEHLLTTPEIVHISRLFVNEGVTKIRLTGGEPTVRKDIVDLAKQIGDLKSIGLKELCITTNGLNLSRKLDDLVEAGLTGVNLSLDTLDPHQFTIMTRRNGHAAVLRSIERILEMNQQGASIKLKINCVVMRGINEREIIPFVELGREKDIEVRFIEYMPFDGNKWSKGKMVGYAEILAMIKDKYPQLQKAKDHFNDTSKTYQIPGFVGRVGFITSMTHNFCGTCNRLRITSDGNLKVCLFGDAEVSLRDMLRTRNQGRPIENSIDSTGEIVSSEGNQTGASSSPISQDGQLLQLIGAAVQRKKARHAGMGKLENMKNRPMILIDEPRVTTMQPWSVNRRRLSQHQLSFMSPSGWPNLALLEKPMVPYTTRLYHSQVRDEGSANDRSDRIPSPRRFLVHRYYGPPAHRRIGVGSIYAVETSKTRKIRSAPQAPPSTSSDGHQTSPASDKPSTVPKNNASKTTSSPQELTHLTSAGAVRMVDISHKTPTQRSASASCILLFSSYDTATILSRAQRKKGDPLSVARIAGIQAVKKTADLIPLAHPSLAITSVDIDITPLPPADMMSKHPPPSPGAGGGVFITSHVTSEGKTGIEMEALTSVTVAALALYDMCKGVDRHMELRSARVVAKAGGKSGDWTLDDQAVKAAFGSGLTRSQASLIAFTARKQARVDAKVFGERVGRKMYSMAMTRQYSGEYEEYGTTVRWGEGGNSQGRNQESTVEQGRATGQPLDGNGSKWADGLWHEWSRQYKHTGR